MIRFFVLISLMAISSMGLLGQDTYHTCLVECGDDIVCPVENTNQNSAFAANDVDSIGDFWVFTIDKSGSMLTKVDKSACSTYVSSRWIASDVVSKLSRHQGILDQINYTKDKITIVKTGYGINEEDSYGYGFRAAQPLEYSFIHDISQEDVSKVNKYSSKAALASVLSSIINKNDYIYRESFVSQIRVLSLHNIVKYIRQEKKGLSFRKIHIVTITDDADVNDQWRMDYYTIKRDPVKMKQLNELHSKYIYSSFTQKGAGYLDEREWFTDTSSKNHIYMYDYTTRQQKTDKIKCSDDSIVYLAPLDGKSIDLKLATQTIANDSIMFVYVDSLVINNCAYPIAKYVNNSESIRLAYYMNLLYNNIEIRGKAQVLYNDSIYGMHFKTYDIIQKNVDCTNIVHCFISLIMVFLVAILVFYFFIPNRTLMVIHSCTGEKLIIKRGFTFFLNSLTPIAYRNENHMVFAKHMFFKHNTLKVEEESFSSCFYIIDSAIPLSFANKDVLMLSSESDIKTTANNLFVKYPNVINELYNKTIAGKLTCLKRSNNRWVRTKLYPALRRIVFKCFPHYYYWGNGIEGVATSPHFHNHPLLFEYKENVCDENYDGLWLNTYYQGNFPQADVLICCNQTDGHVIWDVYQLNSNKYQGEGISSAKHLMHYYQENVMKEQLSSIKKVLKRAIKKELGSKRIVCLNSICVNQESIVHFNISKASFKAYICLVEHTIEEKCQILYSPLIDSDITTKNVILNASNVGRRLYTSLVPFTSNKDLPSRDVVAHCESSDAIHDGCLRQAELSIDNNSFQIENVFIKSNKTTEI